MSYFGTPYEYKKEKEMTPQRVQRKRTKGWNMPDNTVYVGRGSKWGNPFKWLNGCIYIDAGYRRQHLDRWVYLGQGSLELMLNEYEYYFTARSISTMNPDIINCHEEFTRLQYDLHELKGKNLACWCPLDKPCHADILLKLANL